VRISQRLIFSLSILKRGAVWLPFCSAAGSIYISQPFAQTQAGMFPAFQQGITAGRRTGTLFGWYPLAWLPHGLPMAWGLLHPTASACCSPRQTWSRPWASVGFSAVAGVSAWGNWGQCPGKLGAKGEAQPCSNSGWMGAQTFPWAARHATIAPQNYPTQFPRYHPHSPGEDTSPSALAPPSSPLTQAEEAFHSLWRHQPSPSDCSGHWRWGRDFIWLEVHLSPFMWVTKKSLASSAFPSLAVLPCFLQSNFSHPSHHHSQLLCKTPDFTGRFFILIPPFTYRAIVQLPSS